MKTRKPRKETCPNPNCRYYGKEYAMNLVVESTYKVFNGKVKRRIFRCDCGCSFSETYGTFFHYRKNKSKYYNKILKCVVNQVGVRSSAEILEISKDTVCEALLSTGTQIKKWASNTDILLPQGNIEYDEFWTFIKMKKGEVNQGEMWVWIAFHRETRFMIYFVVGKHVSENGYDLISTTKKMITHPCKHSTDALIGYENIFNDVYSDDITLPKTKSNDPQLLLPYPKAPNEFQYGVELHK